ncbi:hypothetical protein L345_04125, partial [Ophiophagus hannah]
MAAASIYEESMPRPCKEMVRGEILPSAWILQPDTVNGKDITKVIYMVQVDLGAPAIPARFLSSFVKRPPLMDSRDFRRLEMRWYFDCCCSGILGDGKFSSRIGTRSETISKLTQKVYIIKVLKLGINTTSGNGQKSNTQKEADRLSLREKTGLEPTLELVLRSTFKRSLLEFSSLDPLTMEDPCNSEAEILLLEFLKILEFGILAGVDGPWVPK